MELGFANRQNELDYICGPTPDSQIIIDAPAGYGKSFLLLEIQKRLAILGWKSVLIKLDEVRGKHAICNQIYEQLGIKIDHEVEESDFDAELRKTFANCGKIILLIDAEERAEEGDRNWLIGDFIPSCITGLTGLYFRVVVTGRYSSTFDGRRILYKGYRRINLQPFNQTTVQQLLELANENYPPRGRELPRPYIQKWAEKILNLSGGHPKSIQKLINALINSNWTLPDTEEEDKRLFKTYIHPEVQILTNNLDELTKKALEILSVFRQFSISTIKALQEKDCLPNTYNPFDILSRLTRIGLVSKNDSLLYSDAIISQFVLARMKVYDPEQFVHLNAIAQEIYDGWIIGIVGEKSPYSLDPRDIVPFYIKEDIYHLCHLLSQPNGILKLAEHLNKFSSILISVFGNDNNDPQRINMLKNYMVSDYDIPKILLDHGFEVDAIIRSSFYQDLAFLNSPERSTVETIAKGEGHMFSNDKGFIDSLAGILDFLKQNAENVLIERWEKRNRGKAFTPPSFTDKELNYDQLQADITKQLKSYSLLPRSGAKNILVDDNHLQNLLIRVKTYQSTIDKYELEMAKPISVDEKIILTGKKEDYLNGQNKSLIEMADLFVDLYSKDE